MLNSERPKRKFFADEETANQYADELMEDRGTLRTFVHRMTAQEQEVVARLLTRVGHDTARLEQLVEIGLRHTSKPSVSVADAIAQFMDSQRADGVGDHMMRNYEATIEKQFADQFNCPVGDLRSPAIDDWLRTFTVPRTRNNKRGHVLTFLRWLQARDLLPHDVQWRLARAIEPVTDVEVLTPEQMSKLLEVARAPQRMGHRVATAVPFIALCGFAGLRNAEAGRMRWEDIHFDRGFIDVRASIVKRVRNTRSRTVPLLPNLKAWLELYRRLEGPICKGTMSEVLVRVAARAGIAWQKNALRHSYASYRVAMTQNEAQVATEIGDLVGTMKRHYKRALAPDLGDKWFGLMPLA